MSTKRIILTVLAVFVVLLGVAVSFNFDPANPSLSKFFPKCPFYTITGLKCPGCGSQRAIHALLNVDLARAAHYNALFLVAVPLIALYWIADLVKKRHPALDNVLSHPITIIILLIAVVAWTILRNIFNW